MKKKNFWKSLSFLTLALLCTIPTAGLVYAALGATVVTGGIGGFAFACCGIFWTTCCAAIPGVGGIAAGVAVGL